MRAVAIFLVIALHISQHYEALIKGSQFWSALIGRDKAMWTGDGVGIFFVLSGFLITSLLLREFDSSGQIAIGLFYTRRAFRILPPLVVYLAFVFCFCLLRHIPFVSENFTSAMFFYRDYYFVKDLWLTQHTWSLSVEEQFYLLWPVALLLLLLRYNGTRAAAWSALALITLTPLMRIGLSKVVPGLAHEEYYTFHSRIDALMSGCFVALCVGKPKFEAVYRVIAKFWWILPLEFWTVSHILGLNYRKSVGLTIDSLVMAFFILWVTRNEDHWLGRFLNSRLMVQAGVLSYSAYLWQTFFLHAGNDTWAGKFPFSVLYIWIVAWASYKLIEQPSLRLRDLIMRHRAVRIPELTAREEGTAA